MKTLLQVIKQTFTAAGEYLKAAWHVVYNKVTGLRQLVRQQMTAQKNAIQNAVLTYWQQHQTHLVWSAAAAAVTATLTVILIYLGYKNPAIKQWVTTLAKGTLRLPAGYALKLIRPVATSVQAGSIAVDTTPVTANGSRQRQPAAA